MALYGNEDAVLKLAEKFKNHCFLISNPSSLITPFGPMKISKNSTPYTDRT